MYASISRTLSPVRDETRLYIYSIAVSSMHEGEKATWNMRGIHMRALYPSFAS